MVQREEKRRKYVRRYKGMCDVFFGLEHRLRKEEMRNSSTKRPRKEPLRKRQAVRIVSTRQEEFLWQSTATWEQLWEQKKGRLSPSQAWANVRAYLLGVLLALGRVDAEE